jgi:glycosyltransferase involved in cell wall biosynthesis
MSKGEPRPRVLLIAESANPEWVSVPLEGWSNARALTQVADIHLLTQVRNREAILRAGLAEGLDFTVLDSEALERPVYQLGERIRGGKGKGWTLLTGLHALTYSYFEHLVWRQFGPRIAAGEFDLVHRITPLSPTVPSLLARRCRRAGVPFVIGPLNGGLPWPPDFKRVLIQEKEWLSYVRSFHKLLPGYHATRRHAAAIIVGSVDAWNQMLPSYRYKLIYIPENGIDPGRFPQRRIHRATRPVRGVFVGRLVPYKGADMLLEAAAPLIRGGGLRLDIIGDGPQMSELQTLVRREGLGTGVTFHGWIEHTRVADYLAQSDLLTFPSVREFGGAVVLEAMVVGLVPVVVDYGGPGELGTEGTGFLIPLGDRSQIIERLRGVLSRIVADPAQIEPKSQAAIRRVEQHFTWKAKAEQILQVYRWVLERRPDKPAFRMPLPDAPVETGVLDVGDPQLRGDPAVA